MDFLLIGAELRWKNVGRIISIEKPMLVNRYIMAHRISNSCEKLSEKGSTNFEDIKKLKPTIQISQL